MSFAVDDVLFAYMPDVAPSPDEEYCRRGCNPDGYRARRIFPDLIAIFH